MDSQLKQANTMVAKSKKELGTPAIGQTVAVPIPTFDRGKGDRRNLLGRIIEVFNLTFFYDRYSLIKFLIVVIHLKTIAQNGNKIKCVSVDETTA
jgi:hypothetical protein